MVRCKNGTRKNKAGDCIPYVSLSKSYIDSIIANYSLKPEAAAYIKKIKATKRRSDFYKYNPNMTDLENLQMKANAKVAEILKFGPAKEKAKIVGL